MFVKKFQGLFFFLAAVILFEAALYLVIPDEKLDTLESIVRVLVEDPVIFWRVRPHLDTKFQGVNVTTNSLGFRGKEPAVSKRPGVHRIFCLGASPTFGWGVDYGNTYPFLLEQSLSRGYPSEEFEVANAGQIGYTTYQGIILLEKYLLRYSPDLITVSYALNDIDRYRFFRNEGISDSELKSANPLAVAVRNILARSRIYLVFKRGACFLMERNKKIYSAVLKKQFNLAGARVSEEDYKRNLERFIDICESRGIKLIFIKMPINLSLPALSASERGALSRGLRLSEFYYKVGLGYEKKNDYHNACIFLKKARDYLVFDCHRDAGVYHGLMEQVASKKKIPLVDAAAIFKRQGNQELFNGPHDPIHPNAEGHRIIAEGIYAKITEKRLF